MMRKYFQYHEPAYHSDSTVRQAALTWQRAKQQRMQHLGDLSGTCDSRTGMVFAFDWGRERELKYMPSPISNDA